MKIASILRIPTLVVLLFFATNALIAQSYSTVDGKSAVGTWKTIDDESNKARSHVKIYEQNGKYYGKIIKLLNRTPDEDQDPICDVCPGDRKDKKVVGMIIVNDMVKGSNRYASGKILDPKKGREYTCTMWLTDKNTLKVRGWWGMLYRTQTWYRVD